MTIDERTRFELHQRLDAVLGAEHAAALMSHLPPVGWADVTTKHDLSTGLALLRSDVTAEIALLRSDLPAEMDRRFTSQTRFLVGTMVALQTATIGAMAVAVSLVA